jgi:hypothetical protein
MAILFRIDFREDWAVGGEKKKLLVPGKDNPEPIPLEQILYFSFC